jgi:hypothetical protein
MTGRTFQEIGVRNFDVLEQIMGQWLRKLQKFEVLTNVQECQSEMLRWGRVTEKDLFPKMVVPMLVCLSVCPAGACLSAWPVAAALSVCLSGPPVACGVTRGQ